MLGLTVGWIFFLGSLVLAFFLLRKRSPAAAAALDWLGRVLSGGQGLDPIVVVLLVTGQSWFATFLFLMFWLTDKL